MDNSEAPQPAGLIGALRDLTLDVGGRDDAAIDLGKYDEPEALAALIDIGSDPATPDVVLWSCGESIAYIWLRTAERLRPEARRELLGTLAADKLLG
jgi:hypothetical protein